MARKSNNNRKTRRGGRKAAAAAVSTAAPTIRKGGSSSSGGSNKKNSDNNRAISEVEKMEKIVALCERLEDVGHKLKVKGYSTEQAPTWYYRDCKKIVNYIEGFARESNVKPSALTAIRFRGSRILPVLMNSSSSVTAAAATTTATAHSSSTAAEL